MLVLDLRAWLFSLKTFAAATCALFVSFACDLPRPYWAMATVYIVSQPMLGATRAKGGYRVAGTLLGAAAAVVMVPNLVNSPTLLVLAMVLWLSVCLFFALLDRTPRSYFFMLAGYTVSLIGFPSVDAPGTIFDVAIGRGEEITLGTICATMAAMLLFPASVKPLVNQRVRSWMDDAAAWCRDALSEHADDGNGRHKLAVDLVQFDQLIHSVAYEAVDQPIAPMQLEQLRARLLLLLPVLSSIGDRMAMLRQVPIDRGEELRELLRDIAAWTGDDHGRAVPAAVPLRERIQQLQPNTGIDETQLLLRGLLLRLREYVDIWQDCRALQHGLVTGSRLAAPLAYALDPARFTRRHRDIGMTLFAVFAIAVALLVYCAIWIGTGWSAGASGVMLGAVAGSIFAGQDDPFIGVHSFMVWSVVSVFVALVYIFGILPQVHDFPVLIAVLFPAFAVIGLLMARPATTPIGMPLAINSATLIGLQTTYTGDFEGFINSSLATVLGIGLVAVMMRLIRPAGARWSARRLMRANWRTLTHAAIGHGRQTREAFAALMLDRLGLLAPRLAAVATGEDAAPINLLSDIRAGLNILDLREGRTQLQPHSQIAVDAALLQVADHYRALNKGRSPQHAGAVLRQHIDQALQLVAMDRDTSARDSVLMGLIGLRYSLCATELSQAGDR